MLHASENHRKPNVSVSANILVERWVETFRVQLGAAGVCSCGLALQTAAAGSLCTGSLEHSSLGLIQSSCEVRGYFQLNSMGCASSNELSFMCHS